MLKFHPYSILTGDTIVRFVIFCVLKIDTPARGKIICMKKRFSPLMNGPNPGKKNNKIVGAVWDLSAK